MTGNVHSRKRFMKEPQIKDYKDIDDWSADYSYYESCKKNQALISNQNQKLTYQRGLVVR